VILQDAFRLFSRLGVDVAQLTHKQFAAAYIVLAKRYHPNGGFLVDEELMKNINAARTTVLQSFRRDE
jgi:hypothetical protein